MKRAARLTTTQRNRALGRLRTFTVGTALASTAATGAFGYLAVVTNPGVQLADDAQTSTTPEVSEVIDSATSSSTTSSATSATATTGGTAAAVTTATATATPALAAATTAPTTTTGRAHASSGGS